MEATDVQVNLNDQLKSEISSLDYYLIHQAANPTFGLSDMEESAKHFLNGVEYSINNQRTGLSALIYRTFFSRNLRPDQRARINEIVEKTAGDSEVVRNLKTSINQVDGFVEDYFADPKADFAVWTPKIEQDSEIAKTVLDLKAQIKMRDLRTAAKKEGKGPEFVFESFVDPANGRYGMWVSSKGIHVDATKLPVQTAV